MVTYDIKAPRMLNADIMLPASKSISNRALIIHALAGGDALPQNLSDCNDTYVVLQALNTRSSVIDIGAAGTAMRFLTAYLAATSGTYTLTGSDRMKQRPIGILVDTLQKLGADISYLEQQGYPPLLIKGHQLHGGSIEIPGHVSSQFISALLLTAPVMTTGLELRLRGEIVSRPYIDLTLCTMKQFGADADWTDTCTIRVNPVAYEEHPFLIENDWTAASYWYETVALYAPGQASVCLHGLMDGSRQGDAIVKYIFSLLGVKTTFDTDLAQTIAVTCCAMGVLFRFDGLASLKIKETDRLMALQKELRKLGYVVEIENDNALIWNGETCKPTSTTIDTYDDHRMAMAFAPLAVRTGSLQINHPDVVTKSYPHFWNDMASAGFHISSNGKVLEE